MSRTAAALLLLVAQIASTNAQEECVGEDSVPGVSLEWDDASVTVKFACYTWEGRTRHTGPESDTRGMRGSN